MFRGGRRDLRSDLICKVMAKMASQSVALLTDWHPPQAAGRRPVKGRAARQQVPVQMQTNIRLQAFRKSFQHRVHVYAIRIRPRVLKVLLESLP